MKVLLVGLKYFTRKLASDLNKAGKKHSFIALDTYTSGKDKLKFLYHLPTADLVFSINGTVTKSRVFDLAIKMNKPLALQWAGSDVLEATKNLKNGTGTLKYSKYASNYCEADWLIDELLAQNISVKKLIFSSIYSSETLANFPEKFSIFTYLGKNRKEFYGSKTILNLAKKYPHYQFYVAGDNLDSSEPNVQNLGWVEDVSHWIRKSVVHIRWTEHDSVANTVLESLAQGRHVIWKNNLECTIQAKSEQQLETELELMYSQFSKDNLPLNHAGFEYIKTSFDKEIVNANFIKEIEKFS